MRYRGCSGIDGIRNLYGEDISFLCSVIGDGDFENPILATDAGWDACENGPIKLTDLELGETCDAGSGFGEWHKAREMFSQDLITFREQNTSQLTM